MKARKVYSDPPRYYLDGRQVDEARFNAACESKWSSIAESGKAPRMDVGTSYHWGDENGGKGRRISQIPGMYATSAADLREKLDRGGYTYE